MMRATCVLLALVACGNSNSSTDAAVVYDDLLPPDDLSDAPGSNMPETLADTGLCVDASCTQITPGILPYTPRFELYSDGATKRRWIWLPPGTTIDTSDMDHWEFPVGTKLWKEFTRDGIRVETRLVMRIGPGTTQNDWFYAAYVWNQTQDATTWAEFGEENANGTEHDVPGKEMCRMCHENQKPSRVLGFSALQLDHDAPAGELDLGELIAQGLVSDPPSAPGTPGDPYFPFPVASTDPAYAALGYLHANCGHCHNPSSQVMNQTQMVLRLTTTTLGSLAETPTYTTAVDVTSPLVVDGRTKIVAPGEPDESIMMFRFESTNPSLRMPAAGTEVMDPAGHTLLTDWITSIQ